MDAKQACDKLNGFNFQNRYLVGMTTPSALIPSHDNLADIRYESANETSVLYHQPEKMARSKEDLAERQQNLENLKRQHGIE